MLIALWMPKSITSPAAAKRQKGSSLRAAMDKPRNTMKAKIARDQKAGENAEFLARHGENEIRMGIWKDALDCPFARPLAEPAAGQEAIERGVHLKRIDHAATSARIDEFEDAGAYMRHNL